MYKTFIKRSLDLLIASILLLLFFPVILLVYINSFFVFNGTPLFFQKRPGCNEQIFSIIKFKTMLLMYNNEGVLLPDAMRMSKWGSFLRKTSIDEIPQLINVIKGDMSLVGPRPLLVEYLPLYNEFQQKRHLVRPGITGWAQVNGRNAIDWPAKFELDVWYVNNLSFNVDLQIIYKTIAKVVRSKDINTEGQATAIIFKGNSE